MANICYRFLLSIHEQISKYLAFSKPQVLFKITCTASSPEASFCSWNCGVHFQHHIGTLRASHVRWRNIWPYPKPNLSESSLQPGRVILLPAIQFGNILPNSSVPLNVPRPGRSWGPGWQILWPHGIRIQSLPMHGICIEWRMLSSSSWAPLKSMCSHSTEFFLELIWDHLQGNLRQAACG